MSAWVVAVDDGKPQGAPELVKSDIGTIEPMGFTRTGAFYYGHSGGMADVYVGALDPSTGRVVTAPAQLSQQFQGRGSSPAWSPDGEFIAYLSRRRAAANLVRGPRVVCIRSFKTGEEREIVTALTFESAYRLRWSPDGRSLLATATDNLGRSGLYSIDVRSGAVETIEASGQSFRPHGVWSLDGRSIIYSHREDSAAAATSIRRRVLATGEETEVYRSVSPAAGPNNLALSTDGQWLAFGLGSYVDSDVLMVMPAVGGQARELHRMRDGEGVLNGIEWAADGRHLFVTKSAGGRMIPELTPELWRISVEGGEPHTVGMTTQRRGTLAVHPDGRHVALTAGDATQEVGVMENLLPPLTSAR